MDIMCASRLCVKASAEYSITFNLVIPESQSPGVMALRFLNLSKSAFLQKAFKRLFRVEAKNVVKRALFDAYYLKTESTYSITMKAFKIVTKLLPNDWIVSMIK